MAQSCGPRSVTESPLAVVRRRVNVDWHVQRMTDIVKLGIGPDAVAVMCRFHVCERRESLANASRLLVVHAALRASPALDTRG